MPPPSMFLSLYVQLSIEEFLMNPKHSNDKDHEKDLELLVNPMSAEFGVRTSAELENLIQNILPDFKLVRL